MRDSSFPVWARLRAVDLLSEVIHARSPENVTHEASTGLIYVLTSIAPICMGLVLTLVFSWSQRVSFIAFTLCAWVGATIVVVYWAPKLAVPRRNELDPILCQYRPDQYERRLLSGADPHLLYVLARPHSALVYFVAPRESSVVAATIGQMAVPMSAIPML